ncbi:hypothetical protein L2106_13585 [Citrobacter portucalensis]|uniref:hypothetical protein n=1 Tax=Citrobacter portucalensis TaxID=1639133 RepID=UPI001F231CD8|nr:hypothetical protein [Citrobacter portucalensis]MDE9574440.1 hypothetical protein [Citrobacter portucalensis]
MGSNIIELAKLGHERAAELKASCGAVDVRSVAQLISDLATQLEVQFVRSTNMAVQLANAESKCRQMAAESAGLKELIEQHANSVAVCPNCSHEEPSETDDIVALYRSMETPATDTFLAEVRAQGVDSLAQTLDGLIAVSVTRSYITEFAAKLRKGVKS